MDRREPLKGFTQVKVMLSVTFWKDQLGNYIQNGFEGKERKGSDNSWMIVVVQVRDEA